jgi:hypothetical protein
MKDNSYLFIDPLMVSKFYIKNEYILSVNKAAVEYLQPSLFLHAKMYRMLACSSRLNILNAITDTNINPAQVNALKIMFDSYVARSGLKEDIFKTYNYCPACMIATVAKDSSTIDHFLPKTLFPLFYVLPDNLVPMCGDCNRVKRDYFGERIYESLPHPYFDERILLDEWFKITFEEKTPITFKIDVSLSNRLACRRVIKHFNIFKLESKCERLLISKYEEEVDFLRERYSEGGGAFLRKYLAFSYNKRVINDYSPSFYEKALYKALSNSDWFCFEYFKT